MAGPALRGAVVALVSGHYGRENKMLDDYIVVCPINVPDVLSHSYGGEQLGCVLHNPK